MVLLFGQYRRQLLALLLLRPGEAFYVRELERLSGIPVGSLHRELMALTDAGLLKRESHGNQVRYQANRECPIFEELAAIFRKTVDVVPAAASMPIETREPEAPGYDVPAAMDRGRHSAALKRLSVSKSAIASVCRKYRIRKFSFFGSATRDDFRPDSDVDVLVEFRGGEVPSLFGLVHLRNDLTKVFGRTAHVVTPAILRNPARRKYIEPDLECVYAA